MIKPRVLLSCRETVFTKLLLPRRDTARHLPDRTWRLSHRYLATDLGLATLLARTLDQFALAMAQLLGEAIRHHIQRLVERVPVVLGVNIRPSQSQVNFDHKGVLERALVIVPQGNVSADQVQSKMFQTFDFLRHIGMDGRSQLNIAGTDMNLHTQSYDWVSVMSMAESQFK